MLPLLRLLFLFLLLPILIESKFKTYPPLNFKDLGECVRKTYKESPDYTNITSQNTIQTNGTIYRMLGLTANCVFFMGNVHDILNSTQIFTNNDTIFNDPALEGACRWHKAYIVKDAETNTPIAVIIDQYGHKIRVQSAVNGKMIRHNSDALYMTVEVFNREQHFYTQPVDRGYQVLEITNIGCRIFVVARNHYHMRIYQVNIGTLENNELYAYLLPQTYDVPVVVAEPTDDRAIRAVTNLDASKSVEKRFADKTLTNLGYQLFSMKTSDDLKNIPGFEIHSTRPNFRFVLTIPLIALQNGHLKGVEHKQYNNKMAWAESSRRFFASWDECWEPWNPESISIIHHKLSLREQETKYRVPASKSLAFWLITTRFFNKRNSHRRMAYPHSRTTQHVFEFKSFTMNIFGCNIGAWLIFGLLYFVFFLIKLAIQRRKEALQSSSITRTQATTS